MNFLARKSILLVEDNRDDEELTLLALQDYLLLDQIYVARDGAEALDFLRARGPYALRDSLDMPQMILLDLHLPKLNGLEVLQRMRAHPRLKRVPVIVLTTSLEEQDIVTSYDCGANSYVRKPVDYNEFLEAVKRLSLYWLVLNEAPRIS